MQVELLAVFRGCAEQPLEASPQVGSLADVGFRLRVVPAKEKHRWCGWDHSEKFSLAGGDELETVREHHVILG